MGRHKCECAARRGVPVWYPVILCPRVLTSPSLAHDAAFVGQLSRAPQYEGITPEEALENFKKRREYYMDVYESSDQRDSLHIQIINKPPSSTACEDTCHRRWSTLS